MHIENTFLSSFAIFLIISIRILGVYIYTKLSRILLNLSLFIESYKIRAKFAAFFVRSQSDFSTLLPRAGKSHLLFVTVSSIIKKK